jgi:hypothetical protein
LVIEYESNSIFILWKSISASEYNTTPSDYDFISSSVDYYTKYDKQDQQEKAAFNERNPYMTQQQVNLFRFIDKLLSKPNIALKTKCHSILYCCYYCS